MLKKTNEFKRSINSLLEPILITLVDCRRLKSLFISKKIILGLIACIIGNPVFSQFVHPGITHKLSDLDRMKYMVEAQVDPWYTSYQEMASDSKSSYNYSVQGNSSFTVLARDSPYTNYGAWNSDIRAAYYNAIRWYVTGDSRHADKAVEIFKAWRNLTSVTSNGTDALSGGVGYIMIEAAEIIKSTYTGWSSADINAFKAMFVYPGYSTSSIPSGNKTFYWMSYKGDDGRHGNQGLSGWRTVMAMGIFLDNETMYQRALRYIKGQSHLSNDLPYGAGAPVRGALISSNAYYDYYNASKNSNIGDYGYNEVMTNYIYENGQCQESSRDQQHTMFGIGLLTSMAEMAWNQGDNLYSFQNNRLLLGLEYNMRYNTTSWVPTVGSGEFIERDDRTLRWRSKAISPDGRGEFFGRPVFEMPIAHYVGRGLKTENQVRYTIDARDQAFGDSGYETYGQTNDHLGWGALTDRRPDYCYGDPISGFLGGLPVYAINVLPMTIEAENFDYPGASSGEDRTYNDATSGNTGGQYRTNENVDIQICDEGGYNVGWIAPGEYLTYTVYVPATGAYNISARIASPSTTGEIKVYFGNSDKTGNVSVPNTGGYQTWQNLVIKSGVSLTKGVQSMKVYMSAAGFNLNNITIASSTGGSGIPAGYTFCSNERETCTYTGTVNIAYGANGSYNYLYNQTNGTFDCSNATFGDPIPGVGKACYVQASGSSSSGGHYKLVKRNSTGFAIDGGSTSLGRSLELYTNINHDNLTWTEIDLGNGYYSFEKYNSGLCMDGGSGGANGQDVTTETCNSSDLGQQWEKIDAGSGHYRLQKRGTSYSLDGGNGGAIDQNVYLYSSSSTNQNQQWRFDGVTKSAKIGNAKIGKVSPSELENTIRVYPNPVTSVLNIEMSNSKEAQIEIINFIGQIVLSKKITSNYGTIDLNYLQSGIYILKIFSKGQIQMEKIIKK